MARSACRIKLGTATRYSILHDNKQIFASEYQLTLPSKEDLEDYLQKERQRLEERDM